MYDKPMKREYITIIVISIIFLILSAISLFYCYKENQKLRKIRKPFPIMTLITLLMAVSINEPVLYLALTCGLIGDLFLISFDKRMFLAGLAFFLIEHLINFYTLYRFTDLFNNYFYLIYGILIVVFPLIASIVLKKFAKPLFTITGGIYIATLVMQIISSIYLTVVTGNNLLICYTMGYILFLISDSLIAQKRFIAPFKKIQFLIMITYYAAQALIYIPLLFCII